MVKYIKTFCLSPRRLQDIFKTCLQDVFKTCLQDVFSVTIFCLSRRLEDIFKTSWRRYQDVLRDVFKTSWKTKKCYAEDVLKTSSRDVLKTSWRRLEDQQMFAGYSSKPDVRWCSTEKLLWKKVVKSQRKHLFWGPVSNVAGFCLMTFETRLHHINFSRNNSSFSSG